MGKKYQYREDTNRTHMVTVRFTDDEIARLNFICDRLNITKAEHIRSSVFRLGENGPVFQIALDSDIARELTAQFGKIGSNLNQIARKLNSGEEADNEISLNYSPKAANWQNPRIAAGFMPKYDFT